MRLAIPHEAAFIAKGYTRVKPKKELARWGSPLRASTAAYHDLFLFNKVLNNPVAGRIRLSLLPVEVESDEQMGGMLDQLECIVTSPEPAFDNFLGERSPVFNLNEAVRVVSTPSLVRAVDSWQFKGFLYRPQQSSTESSFPRNDEYVGIGANPLDAYFLPHGQFSTIPSKSKIKGPLTFDEVILEMLYPHFLSRRTVGVSPSFGMGEFLERPLRNGFAIHFIEGQDRLRTFDCLAAILKNMPPGSDRTNALLSVYRAMAVRLSSVHELGVAMRHPHPENFSFRLDLSATNGKNVLQSRLHDFDGIAWGEDYAFPALFGYSLFDLSEISILNEYCQLGSLPSTENGIEAAAQNLARSRSVTFEEAKASFQHYAKRDAILRAAEKETATELMPAFLLQYFSKQQALVSQYPLPIIKGIARNLSSQIATILEESKNPSMAASTAIMNPAKTTGDILLKLLYTKLANSLPLIPEQ
ncbi:MAG: hypothetical protein WC890_07290 [Candidatus Margulisiibacteriota bacterium]